MRKVGLAVILSLLSSQGAFAAQDLVLTPGGSAGIKLAQLQNVSPPVLVMGAAGLGIGIALAVAGDDDAAPVTPTTATSP